MCVSLFFITGCSKQPAADTPLDTTIDYLTGSAQIKQGQKASQKLKNIANKRGEDFEELGM